MLEKILVPSDLSAASNSVLPYAITLGQAFNSKLYLLHVMDPGDLRRPEKLDAFPRISTYFDLDRGAPDLPPLRRAIAVGKVYRYADDPEDAILKFAHEKSVDLLCLATTTNERKLAWWSAGAITDAVLKKARCSVFCMRGRAVKPKDWTRPRFKNVLLLVELTDAGTAPLFKTLPLVHMFNSILHVFPLFSAAPSAASENPLREVAQLDAQTNVLLFATPNNGLRNLLRFVRHTDIDLIVMPAHLRTKLSTPFVRDALVRLFEVTSAPILILR